MSIETQRALMSWIKFAGWAAIAAGIEALIDGLTTLQIGEAWGPLFIIIVGACLKAAATWVATKRVVNGGGA